MFELILSLMAFSAMGYVYCSSDCGSLQFPESYAPEPTEGDPCPSCTGASNCINGFALVTCDGDAKPANLTDTESIDTLKTAGKIFTFKDVYVTRNQPTTVTFTPPGSCGKTIIVRNEEIIDVLILCTAADRTDEEVFDAIAAMNNKWGVILKDADDYTYLAKDWIAAFKGGDPLPDTQMGIQATLVGNPYKSNFVENEPTHWKMQIKLTYTGILQGALIPAFIGTI
jgi:hypothetical protein